MSVGLLVCRYFGWSVSWSPLALSAFLCGFSITAPAQMLGLAFCITAPAHPHATSVAVHPAMFDTSSHLCEMVCPSVGRSVDMSIH